MLLLATMMIPGEMMVITNFVTVSKFGWYDADGVGSFLAMIVPFLVSIFHIYLLRQNFRQIPNELYYAAKVDGCGDFKYLWKVMVPMAKSSLVTIIILKLMGTWNAYIWPNLVANEKYKLVTVWLRSSFNDEITNTPMLNVQMAATIIVTLPLLLLFIFFRKYIMSGVSRSGTKG
jgi:multiple sugar transport system permease protein